MNNHNNYLLLLSHQIWTPTAMILRSWILSDSYLNASLKSSKRCINYHLPLEGYKVCHWIMNEEVDSKWQQRWAGLIRNALHSDLYVQQKMWYFQWQYWYEVTQKNLTIKSYVRFDDVNQVHFNRFSCRFIRTALLEGC